MDIATSVSEPELDDTLRFGKFSLAQYWLTQKIAAGEDLLERHEWVCVAMLIVTFVPLALLMAHVSRLSSDEFYTWRIAQQPTVRAMLHLSREVDMHPPLHYFLQRAALKLPLPLWLGSRLPSLIAGQLTLLVLFELVSKRLGRVAGLMTATVFWFSPAMELSWTNRPYELCFLFLALTAWFWSEAISGGRRWWVPVALGAAALCMVGDAMFGLVCLLVFVGAEAVRSYRRRRLDWPVMAALLLPCLMGLGYLYQLRSFGTNSFSARYLPTFGMGVNVYSGLVNEAVFALVCCCGGAMAMVPDALARRRSSVTAKAEELFLLGGLVALPIALMVIAALRSTQFFPRYAACGAVGLAVLAPVVVWKTSRRAAAIGVLFVVALLVDTVVRIEIDTYDGYGTWRASKQRGVVPQRLEALDPKVPIVVAGPTEFTELNQQSPREVARRLVYVTDREQAERYSGQTLFENEDKMVKLLDMPGSAEALRPFLAEHPKFYLIASYGDPEQWVLRYLLANHVPVEYLGKYVSTVPGDDLYGVNVQP